jgi:hypothetical protein
LRSMIWYKMWLGLCVVIIFLSPIFSVETIPPVRDCQKPRAKGVFQETFRESLQRRKFLEKRPPGLNQEQKGRVAETKKMRKNDNNHTVLPHQSSHWALRSGIL